MHRRSAFTLVEVIVVIAIIALLAALAAPVFIRAKQSANETICLTNFKQFHAALELYRADWSSSDVGTPAQMGMPTFASALLPPAECRGQDEKCLSPGSYTIRWPNPNPATPNYSVLAQDAWAEYVGNYGPSSVLMYDESHQDHCPHSEFSKMRVLGVNLGGSVFWRVRRGDPNLHSWWHEIPRGGTP